MSRKQRHSATASTKPPGQPDSSATSGTSWTPRRLPALSSETASPCCCGGGLEVTAQVAAPWQERPLLS